MITITLLRGLEAYIDDQFKELANLTWHAQKHRKTYRVTGHTSRTVGHQHLKLHHEVWKLAHPGEALPPQIDHVDRNGLNNRLANLRPASGFQNKSNTAILVNNTSGFIGVNWNKARNKWMAKIQHQGHQIYLGLFDDPAEAATVYNTHCLKLHDKFAVLNEV